MVHNDALTTAPSGIEAAPPCLSAREKDILGRAARGATDKEIADAIDTTVASLRAAWNRIREKLGAVNRTHAIALATLDAPRDEAQDLRGRLVESLTRDRVASWVWRPRHRHALLDDVGARMFSLPAGGDPVAFDRLLVHIWAPDRARFERYLRQCVDLRPMTPIELRVGVPGDYRQLIRTVNLATGPGMDGALLLASTTIHTFPA